MFDKNVFKEKFRVWSEQAPFASVKEMERFCEHHIPAEFKEKYSWLIEESISWFTWRQENLQRSLLQDATEVSLKN